MRNRRGLNKIWMLALALLIALGAMGVTYSAWTDDIYIEGSLYTGDINTLVSCNGACTKVPTDVPDTSMSCSPILNETMKLRFSVTNATPNVTYYCGFKVENLDVDTLDPFESLPVKIDSFTLTPQGTYAGLTVDVINLPLGTQIDAGGTVTGTVRISVASDAPIEPLQNPVYILEVTVVRWNVEVE